MDSKDILSQIKSDLDVIINTKDCDRIGSDKYNTSIHNLNSLVESTLYIKDYRLDIIKHKNEDYVVYRFRDTSSLICKAGFTFNKDTFINDLATSLDDIKDGIDALSIINQAIDKKQIADGNSSRIYYKWGKSSKCTIGNWNYTVTRIKVSSLVLEKLLLLYRKDIDSYKSHIEKIISENNINYNVIEIISKFNELGINKELQAELLDIPIAEHLTTSMLNRKEILELIKKNIYNSENQEYQSVELIDGLGHFACIVVWEVDYQDKSIKTSLLDEQVIDIDDLTITSNYAICSKIEQQTCITTLELGSIFEV